MFHTWNPDPVAIMKLTSSLNPVLARVVRNAQADNPSLRFVIGSGRRNDRLQRMAVAWGWSKTQDSPHRSGNAGTVAARPRGPGLFIHRPRKDRHCAEEGRRRTGRADRWGGRFRGFKDWDRSHFEVAPP